MSFKIATIESGWYGLTSDYPDVTRVLFISNARTFKNFAGLYHPVAWYEDALAANCDGRLHIGVAYPADLDAIPPASGSQSVSNQKAFVVLPQKDNVVSSAQREVSAETYDAISNIEYFPLPGSMSVGVFGEDWEMAKRALLATIEDFKPDIIQCLGCEWPYGIIAEDVDVPIVVHMMGFLNIYYPALKMVYGYRPEEPKIHPVKKALFSLLYGKPASAQEVEESHMAFERRIMKANHYFMGRTKWDERLVKYYSPGAQYFNVPEFMRWPYLREAGSWSYQERAAGEKFRLLTISSADDRKGNGIILQTAKLLKDLVGIDFEWRVAGHKNFMPAHERYTGISCEEVGVQMIGMIEAEQIIDELQSADLFIHPSIVDNSPNTICEAQLIGCPVISSCVGGVPQLIDDGKTGFLYPYNEPHTLAFLIADLLGDKATLERVSQAESAMACKRHDPVAIANRYVEVYEKVIDSHEE